MYSCEERRDALDRAMTLYADTSPPPDPPVIVSAATVFLAFLSGATLCLTPDPFTYDQGSDAPPQLTRFTLGGNVQLTDTQQVSLAVEPLDSKGQPASDTLTWSSADSTVVALTPSADTLSCLCVAGNPGLGAVVTVTDGIISATESFDVVAGAAASLVIAPGAPEEQPVPAPAPTPAPAPAP